jgi:tmRNA-binding protein
MASSAFFDKNNRFKMNIFLAKGKKLYDKRADIKGKDLDRQAQQDMNTI